MQFAHPGYLWLLVLLPPLALWWLRGRRRAAVRHPASAELRQALPRRGRWVEALSLGLRLGAAGLLIVGLARPRWPDLETRIPARSTAIQMVLDVSGSMAEQDFTLAGQKVSRLHAARHAFRRFVQGDEGRLPGRFDDLIGLVTFAARSEDVCPPTLSHSVVLRMLDEATPVGTPPDSSTNIGDAMIEGLHLLQQAQPKNKLMIVLSDGEHNVPETVVAGAQTPRQAAQLARALDVRVYTVFVGPTVSPAADRTAAESAELGKKSLQEVAQLTGGRFFHAQDAEGLLDVCREIDRLERTRVESFQYYRYHEAYPWVGLACLVLFLGCLALEGRRWLRVP
jgi:Ca-activated chloride channel family protein